MNDILKTFLALGMACCTWTCTALIDHAWTRETLPFDQQWDFAASDSADPVAIENAVVSWQHVDLPHDWAIAGPFRKDNPAQQEGGFLPTGVCWYRRKFSLPAEYQGQRVSIEFDGVMANSDVWINDHHLGHRPSGYVSFQYDLTDHCKFGPGEQNVLFVRVDTSQQVASRWYTGTGVYRHVRMIVVDPLHIDHWGISITTPEVSPAAAVVHVSTKVRNENSAARTFTVVTRILSPAGEEVASTREDAQAGGMHSAEVLSQVKILQPELWDIDTPRLYTAIVTVESHGNILDQVETPFGIRKSEFRSETGYWLNGRNVKIKGVCLHHCCGALGAAVPQEAWRYRLARLRELGVNAVRTAHNPPDPMFLDVCDQMGLLVMDEFFDCWTVGKRKYDYHLYFDEWAHTDARDTILRDRNHPSVILYSVGNEIHDTPKEELAKRILRGLVQVCHETDPSRPVTQALFRPNVSHDYDNGLADMLDVIGTNYRDQELLQAWRDKPGRKIIGTEQQHERGTWLACRDNPQHAGQFLWVGIDYLGESPRWPITTFNGGLLDRTGFPHPRGLERRSWWGEQPMVRMIRRVAATEATPTDPGYEAVQWRRRQALFPDWTPQDLESHAENVEVVSNCPDVELLLNGKSLGSKSLPGDARPRSWEVPFEPGILLAIGRKDGKEVARHELRTAGEATAISLTAHKEHIKSDWEDVVILEARIVDDQGVQLPRAQQEVKFAVSGPGEIVAVDNGSIVSHEPFQATSRRAFQGRCIAIVRATADAGNIDICASSPGLKMGKVTLHISH